MARNNPPPFERRQTARLRTRLPVDYCPLVTQEAGLRVGGMQRGVVVDLSQGGVLVTDVGYLKVGALVHLFLRLPDLPGPIACYARVVRRERAGYGIRFVQLRPSDRQRVGRRRIA